jgi:hypothetical protein
VQVLEQQFLLALARLPVGGAFVPGTVRVGRLLREREQGVGQAASAEVNRRCPLPA